MPETAVVRMMMATVVTMMPIVSAMVVTAMMPMMAEMAAMVSGMMAAVMTVMAEMTPAAMTEVVSAMVAACVVHAMMPATVMPVSMGSRRRGKRHEKRRHDSSRQSEFSQHWSSLATRANAPQSVLKGCSSPPARGQTRQAKHCSRIFLLTGASSSSARSFDGNFLSKGWHLQSARLP
jgi:hypothetical protein